MKKVVIFFIGVQVLIACLIPNLLFAQNNTSNHSAISKLNFYGWEAFNEGNYKEASYFFKKALELNPQDYEALYGLSWIYFKENKFNKAIKGFNYLFSKNYRKKFVAKALFFLALRKREFKKARYYFSLMSLDDQKRFKTLLKQARRHKNKKTIIKAKKKEDINQKKLKKIFKLAKEKEWKKLIIEIKNLTPKLQERNDIQKIWAWSLFNTEQAEKAKKIFIKLYQKDPNKEYVKALSICAFKTNDIKLLKSLFAKHSNNVTIKKYLCDLRRKELQLYFDQNDNKFLDSYNEFVHTGCLDRDYNIRELVAWFYLKNKKYNRAKKIFLNLDAINITRPSIKRGLLECSLALGDEGEAWFLADNLKSSKDIEYRQIASDFFYRKNLIKRASYIYSDPSTSYFNAYSPRITFEYNYHYIDGDSGTSKLHYQEIPQVNFYYRIGEKLGGSIGISNVLIQSGSIGQNPWLGTPILKNTLSSGYSSVSGIIPYLWIEFEDKWLFNGRISSTPINGPVGAMPTFELSVSSSDKNRNFTIFQAPVARSLLSFVGQRDPYTGKYWGRVLATGVKGKMTINLRYLWLGINARYNHLWGKNTLDNNEYSGGISIGKSLSFNYFSDFSYGLFVQFMHFEKNSNFYTFGHGGYFSPQFFVATGPFIHALSKIGNKWLIDFSCAASYINFYEESSPIYPISKEFQGRYGNNQSSKIGYSSHLSGGYLITPNIMVNLHAGINQSADFSEWHAGIGLKFFFEPRNGLFDFDIFSNSDLFFQ